MARYNLRPPSNLQGLPMTDSNAVIDWLLGADPAIRWQAMRDLLDAPESAWQAERAKVEHEGWGARLLSAQDPDGQWDGGAFVPAGFDSQQWKQHGQPWTATCFALTQLREFGLDPACERARRTVELVGAHSRWDEGGQPYWAGEVEECINGRTVADGAYFGVDVSAIVARLLGERLDDGGWNCERCNGSRCSSFATTLNVLEGLLEYERASGGSAQSRQARRAGEEYLLRRHLFRRLSTGEPADPRFLQFLHPNRWRYDVLRALDYFRDAALLSGSEPDQRLHEAVEHLRGRRSPDGTWPLDWSPGGRVWFDMDDGPGRPSRWLTLRALRVLKWWDGAGVASLGTGS
ncbi:squalene cyclase [Lysobacter gummosus]|uniref:squalene cyclase n=2 Tax=Lysobacter gummosus TaxID=262324 RepID=UPI0036253F45